MRNITCLQIHNDYLIAGGETKSAKLIAAAMEKSGIQVIRYYRSNQEIKSDLKGKICSGIQSLYSYKTYKEIEMILKENQIDFALVHNTSPLISNSLYAVLQKHGIPIVKYLQNYNLLCLNGAIDHGEACAFCKNHLATGIKNKCYKNSLVYSLLKYASKRMLDKKYLDKISAFIAISEFVKEKHVLYGLPAYKIHTIYHFVDKPADYTLGEGSTERDYAVYMGRLSQEKGIYTLLKAFAQMPDIDLKIMGSGGMENELRTYVQSTGINNVQFMGFCDGEEKAKLLCGAKLMVVPSEWDEPFGRIVIEAYQYGTPVIATNKGGLPELVKQGKTGYVYRCGDVDDLIEKVNRIVVQDENEYIKMRIECKRMLAEQFTESVYVQKLRMVVDKVVGKGKKE